MGLFLDIFLLAIIILNIIIGYKRGLIKAIVSICAFLIAIIVSLLLYKPISNIIINNTSIDDQIKELIINNNTQNEENKEELTNQESSAIEKYISNKIKDTEEEAKTKTIEIVAETVSIKAIQILTAIIIFILVRIIIILLKIFTDAISELPIIKQFNQIGGITYGIIKSIIIIYLILTILFVVISINGNGIISRTIEESYVTKYLYENNIIVNYCLLGKNLL